MHAGAAGGCAPAGDDTGAGGGFRSAGGVDGTDDTNTSNTTSNNTTRSNTTAHANITNSDSNVQSAGGGLVQLRVGGAGQVTEGGVKSLLTPGRPSAASLQLLDVSECGLGALSLTLAHQVGWGGWGGGGCAKYTLHSYIPTPIHTCQTFTYTHTHTQHVLSSHTHTPHHTHSMYYPH